MSTEVYKLVLADLIDELGKRTMPLNVLQNCSLNSPNHETIVADTTYLQVARSLGLNSVRYFGVVNSYEDRFLELTAPIFPFTAPALLLPPSELSVSAAETYSVPKPELTLDHSSLLIIPSLSENLLQYATLGANLFIDGFMDNGVPIALSLLKTIQSSEKEFEIILSLSQSDLIFFRSISKMPESCEDLQYIIHLTQRLSNILNRSTSILYRDDNHSTLASLADILTLSPVPNFERQSNQLETKTSRVIFNATFICAYAQSTDKGSSSLLLANAAEAKYLQDGQLPSRENILEFLKSAKFKKPASPLIPDAHERRRYIIAAK